MSTIKNSQANKIAGASRVSNVEIRNTTEIVSDSTGLENS